jgi:PKD repeat protein
LFRGPKHVSPIGCEPYDTVRITSIIDSTCYIRNANGAFLPFNLFLIDTINITPGYPTPHYAYRRGEWIFEDIRTVRKNVINQVDLINQSHEYQKAGYWLIKLIGNARDNIDTTQLCRDSDSRIDTIPMVSDFIYTFSCDSAGYKIKVKAQATYVQGFTPDHFTYYYNGNNYNAPDGDDIEFRIVDTVDQVCLMVSSGDYSCQKCITINIPAELLSPEIKITDTICASTALQFDIMDENFTDDITSYLWDFGDGIQSRIRRPIHVFSIFDTTATVSLYVTNKWGCMAMSTKTVAIVKNTLSGYLTVDSLQCESHREINFNKQTGRSPLSYLWNTSDTTSSIIINQTGTYDITVTDPYGCKVILDTFVPVSESFTNELVGPDSICSNLVNPKFTFYGSNSLYDYFVTEKELPSGSEDTIAFSFLGNNIYEFTFDKTGKTGVYRITIRAYLEGTQTICDSIIHEIKINEPDIPLILDSLNSCKPYTYILKESNNLNLKWYEIGSQGLFVLDTGSQISVHKGGKYIGFYTNSHGCTETDTVEIEDQINLRPFISGCYEICDTILDKGNVFIPILGDDVTYNWWKYKHLDSNFVIKQGTNSKVDSFLLQKKHAGKMYLVVESQNGCVDSSDLLCLLVDRCFPPIDCDTVSMTCPHLAFIKDSFDCDSMFGYYQVFGNIVLGNEGFTLCTPNPFIINNLEWVEQPTIDVEGNIITFSGGKLRMHVDSCTGEIIINVRLCKNGAECVTELAPYDFECYNNTCGLGRAITYLQANGSHKVDVTGYVDNVVNCEDDHHWVRVRLYDENCTVPIDYDYVAKTGFNKFRALFDVPDTSAADCYCLKVCLSTGGAQCELECSIPFCIGSSQYLSSGGNGNINIAVACASHTTTGNIYSYSASFDGNAYDIYLDSLIYEAETMSHSCSEGTCSGAFKIDTLATTVDMTLFFNNPNFPFQTIAIDTTVSLPNCNGGGGGHHLQGKDTGNNKSKSGESLITTQETLKGSSLSLIPNPANSSTTIYFKVPDKEDGWEISILDFAGKSFEKKICCDLKGNFKFDCSDRASGMYFVILKKNGKITASKKLLIIK